MRLAATSAAIDATTVDCVLVHGNKRLPGRSLTVGVPGQTLTQGGGVAVGSGERWERWERERWENGFLFDDDGQAPLI